MEATNVKEILIDSVTNRLNKLCRLCLKRKENMVSILDEDILQMITVFFDVEIDREDGLPTLICILCKNKMENLYNFKRDCEKNYVKLKQHVKIIRKLTGQDKCEKDLGVDNSEKMLLIDQLVVGLETKAVVNRPVNRNVIKSDNRKIIRAENVKIIRSENVKIIKSDNRNVNQIRNFTKTDSKNLTQSESRNFIQSNSKNVKIKQEQQSEEYVLGTTAENLQMELEDKINEEDPLDVNSVVLKQEEETYKDYENRVDEPNSYFKPVNNEMLENEQIQRSSFGNASQLGFICGTCRKWFATKSTFIRHIRIHTGEKPFVCHICQRAFVQNEVLIRHLMTHSGLKPFQCEECDKSFAQRDSLKMHMRKHQNLGVYQLYHCKYCPKSFNYASGLSRHAASHTGRTYECENCKKSFTDKSSLLRHKRNFNHYN